jgi:pyrroloquinoline-quinone synthase
MDLARFERVALLPNAARYRALIDDCTTIRGWPVAVAVTTLFLEGTSHERALFDPSAPARPEPPLAEHPLVVHYGLPVERLALVRAHRDVEGEHREAGWRMVLDHIPPTERVRVVAAMDEMLAAWLAYRDDVAAACGLTRT